MLLQSTFPPDIRLEKEIKSLSAAGYNLTVLCNQYYKNEVPSFEGCNIVRLKAHFNREVLNKILNFPLFINPRFIIKTIWTYLRVRPSFIHAHDLPMVPLGLLIKFLFGVPVIFDMHENYPEALKEFKKKGVINFLFKNYRTAKFLESFCIKRVDRIITVVDENFNRLLKRGVPKSKLVVVSNTVDLNSIKENQENFIKESNEFVLTYSGGVSPERDLETAVLAMNYLNKELPEQDFTLLGMGHRKNL